jgi:diacylglycerol O-acyltransferase / wax synthase
VNARRNNARMEPIALTDEDRAILELEDAAVAGHTCKVVLLGAPAPDVAALRESVAARMDAAPALRWRLSGPADAPAWVEDEDFDIEAHVVAAQPARDPVELRQRVAQLFEERLDRARPLWRMDVVALEEGAAGGSGAAVVWRIHHALADGTTAMRFADAVLWDPAEAQAPPHAPHPHAGAAHSARHGRFAAFLRHEVALGSNRSPFDGDICAERVVAFAAAPLGGLHDAAKQLAGATVNDAVLATVAGSLREWIRHHHGHLCGVRVKVPVSLHHAGDDEGNRDSYFTLELPLGEPDPVARLDAIRTATSARKSDHDAETLDRLMHELAGASPRLEALCRQLERNPRTFALNVSNVPGPRAPVRVLGAPVEAAYSLAEIGRRHALRIAVVSVCDQLQFGLCADPTIVHDVELLARGVEAEAQSLLARV